LGGSALAADEAAPYKLITPVLSSSTSWYFESEDRRTGCRSARVLAFAQIHSIPALPQASAVRRCGPGLVTFTGFLNGGGDGIRLFGLPSGGEALATDNSFPYELATPFTFLTQTYYLEAFSSATGCASERLPVVAEIETAPATPSATNVSRCGVGPVTLTVLNESGSEVRLYAQETGGLWLGSGLGAIAFITTPALNSNVTFYIASARGNCESARSLVEVRVTERPSPPSGASVSRCGAGSVNLTLSSGQGVERIEIYNSASGGQLLGSVSGSGGVFMLPFVSSSSSYYLESVKGNCRSDRALVSVTILPLPSQVEISNVSRCGGGVVTLTASSLGAEEIRLYEGPNGGFAQVAVPGNSRVIITTGVLSRSVTYYVAGFASGCESERRPVTITVAPVPPTPRVGALNRCGAGNVTLTVQTLGGSGVRVYDAMQGGNLLASGGSGALSFTFNLSSTATFYVSAVEGGCESARARAEAAVGVLPGVPAASDLNLCAGNFARFTALMGSPLGQELRLYDENGQLIDAATVSPYILEAGRLQRGGVYAIRSRLGGCESESRLVRANVVEIPRPPLIQNITVCGGGKAIFSANVPGGAEEVRYYDAQGLEVGRSSAAPFLVTIDALSGGAYSASAWRAGCQSERSSFELNVINKPAPPQVSDFSRCGAGGVTITATISGGAERLRVYDALGNLIGESGFPYAVSLPFVSETGTYYASSLSGGCESELRAFVVRIGSEIGRVDAFAGVRCSPGTFTITLSGAASEYRLYSQPSGGTVLGISLNAPYRLESPFLSTSATYYVSGSNGSCESARVPVLLRVESDLRLQTSVEAARCDAGGRVSASATGGGGNYLYRLGELTRSSGLFEDLPPGVYTVSVTDIGSGCATSQTVTVGRSAPPLAAITALEATQVQLSWSSVGGASGYEVRYRPLGAGTYSSLKVSATTVLLTNLTPGVVYEFSVRALCPRVESEFGESITFTTPSMGLGCSVNNVNVTVRSQSEASASWNGAAGGVVCYVVSYGLLSEPLERWQEVLVPHPQQTVQLTGLIAGGVYGVRVRGNCSNCSLRQGGLGAWSGVVSFSQLVGRAQAVLSSEDFSVYPNPSSGLLSVSLSANEPGVAEFRVMDIMGRMVYSQSARVESGENTITLELSALPSGVYLLEAGLGESKRAVRIILN
jgi:hypothetical protein